VKPANPHILGNQVRDDGTDFAIWAAEATRAELCLFDFQAGVFIERRFELTHRDGAIWHGHIEGVGVGQRYGYRIDGPWNPDEGARFNPAKLLIDPYAHLLDGEVIYAPEIYGHRALESDGSGDLNEIDNRNSAGFIPFSVVTADSPRILNRPNTSWKRTLIYEAHVKGLTAKNHEIAESERGSYKALSHPSTINYLKSLGVTALELLPIHHFTTEVAVAARGRVNHWGYNPIAFSAPHRGYAATDDPIGELQASVDALHLAGIEVILDVVYNHSAEEGLSGPTYSFKGLGNRYFYRHRDQSNYEDLTGCGNTLDSRNPFVTQMILDSLKWWSQIIGVDGFRFDLTTAIWQEGGSDLITAIISDPILSKRKLIAEPWDVTSYQLGAFPPPFREWNDAYRDGIRQFWLADNASNSSSGVSNLAKRIAGSDDIFSSRGPTSSINFITAHDGFTLNDLTCFSQKNNEVNGEDNRDGNNENRSWNLGVEGESSDLEISAKRAQLQRSIAATLLLSSGVPMLAMGDEISRTQHGCNNAYSLSPNHALESRENLYGGWALDWKLTDRQRIALESIAALSQIRSNYLIDAAEDFFTGDLDQVSLRKDIAWFQSDGSEMSEQAWQRHELRYLGFAIDARDAQGLFIAINGGVSDLEFRLPGPDWGNSYRTIFDSSESVSDFAPVIRKPDDAFRIKALALQIWLINRS
jgi:glycogen operon protein